MKKDNTCNLGGDTSNNCTDCVYNIDYHSEEGICMANERSLEDIEKELEKVLDEADELQEQLEDMWAASVIADYEANTNKQQVSFEELLEELGITREGLEEAMKNL